MFYRFLQSLWFSVVILAALQRFVGCSATIPSYRYSEQSPKVLSPESSNNVTVAIDSPGVGSRVVPYAAVIGGTCGLGWFSWRLAKHHVRKGK